MTLNTTMAVKVGSLAGALLGWGSEVALLLVGPDQALPWMVAAATLAGVGTLGVLLSVLYVSPTRAYQLGYDVGWRDGRRAERLTAEQERVGVVTRLPEPSRIRA